MNPLSQLGILRSALGFSARAAGAASTATGELVGGVSQTFHDILTQASESSGAEHAARPAPVPGSLQQVQADLLAAVRDALTGAGISLERTAPVELEIGTAEQSRGVVSVAQGHPQRAALEMILRADPDVLDAAQRLVDLQPVTAAPAQPLRLVLAFGDA